MPSPEGPPRTFGPPNNGADDGAGDFVSRFDKQIKELSLRKQVEYKDAGLGLDDSDSTLKDRLDLLKAKSREIYKDLSEHRTLSPQQKKELIENLRTKISTLAKEVIGEDGTDSDKQLLQKLTDREKYAMKQFIGAELLHGGAKSEGGGSAGFAGAPAGVADLDKEASRKSGPKLRAEAKHSSAPPSNVSSVQQNIEKPANDQFKPEFLTQITSTVQGGLEYLKQEIANDLSLNKVLDLFIESQDKTLRDLNAKFGQSDEESNIERELQKAFEKFKQDFTSTQKTVQTTQTTQYQQEAQKLQESIAKSNLTSEQKDKLIALATQNDQKDLAKKLQNNSEKLTKPQQEQLIKLVQQDLFTKQESQLVPKITATIIANDNQPIVSEPTKQEVFQRIADELKPSNAIQETTKKQVLEKIVNHKLDKKTPDYATIEPSIAQLKTELQKATNAPAQQQILVQFLAQKDIPQQAKDVVLQILESTETNNSLQQQARQDFINEVKIATLATQLQDTKPTLEKQQILVQFLANRTNSSITAEVEIVLQKIKKEEKEEETKSPSQERTDFVRKIEEQSDAIRTFTQHHSPEPESGEISQEDLEMLKQSKFWKYLAIKDEDLQYLTDITVSSKVDEILQKELSEMTQQDKQDLQGYVEKRTEFLEKISQEPSSVETGSQVDLSISVESIETQKKTFDAVLKLFGVKYKSDREKFLSIFFTVQNAQISIDDQMKSMYIRLEKPIEKTEKYDILVEKILTSINEDLMQNPTLENQKKIEKNKLTILKIQNRKKSFKSLLARIKKAINQS